MLSYDLAPIMGLHQKVDNRATIAPLLYFAASIQSQAQQGDNRRCVPTNHREVGDRYSVLASSAGGGQR